MINQRYKDLNYASSEDERLPDNPLWTLVQTKTLKSPRQQVLQGKHDTGTLV